MSSPQAVTRAQKMKLPKALQRTEHDEQKELFAWIEQSPMSIRAEAKMAFAIPNFSGRLGKTPPIAAIRQAQKLKAEGRKAGVPDVFLPVARGGSHGLFVEMKRGDGIPSDVSREQREWSAALMEQGYLVRTCYGFEQAREVITEYLTA